MELVVSTEAKSTSPQAVMKANTQAATVPGRATGSTTRNSAPQCEVPSTSAASSMSRGIELKKPASIHTAKGRANVR